MLKTVNQSADYAKSNLLTRFFDGECEANGMIIDRFGRIRQTVKVTMHGYWAEDAFKMDEVFTYQDGRVEERNWTVNFEDANNFLASIFRAWTPRMDRERFRRSRSRFLERVGFGRARRCTGGNFARRDGSRE